MRTNLDIYLNNEARVVILNLRC